MLAACRRITLLDRTTRAGKFLKTELRMSSFELCQKTIGIIGLGNIGKRVAKRVLAFEPKEVLYHDIVRQEQAERELGVKLVPRDELLQTADIITLHVPLDGTTRNMIAAREFGLMKKTALLVNTCRGGVVNESALFVALNDQRILGAGIDVFEKEPTIADNPLFTLENIVVTPHAAGATYENVCNVAQHCFDNIVRFAEGKPLPAADIIVPPAAAHSLPLMIQLETREGWVNRRRISSFHRGPREPSASREQPPNGNGPSPRNPRFSDRPGRSGRRQDVDRAARDHLLVFAP